jgi:hypothetical protein
MTFRQIVEQLGPPLLRQKDAGPNQESLINMNLWRDSEIQFFLKSAQLAIDFVHETSIERTNSLVRCNQQREQVVGHLRVLK